MIKCLPEEVQGKLRSGVAMPSLQQCVEELILNSIDAEATCVGVRMDMEAFKVQVIDNGAGMNAEDMECVGNRYFTSKCSSVEDLDNLSWYGFRGEALASVVSLATLVEISSRTRSSVKTHVKIFKDGKSVDVFEAETSRPSAGTTVVICNFFYSLPVRRKRMDPVLEGERIRHRVEAISLMHPFVSFTLKNDCTGTMLLQLPKAKNTYHRFVQIHGLYRAQNLGEISHTHKQFQVIGFIGREGHYNNSLQFLYVNDRLLLKTLIHKLLNLLLRRLSSLNKKNDNPGEVCSNKSPKHKRSQELHGVYIINIKCSYSEYDVCLEPTKTLIEFKDWDSILLCIEEAVKVFLKRENLMDEISQDDLSPKLSGTQTTDQEWHNSGTGGQAISSVSTLEHSIGLKLASEPVHRKCKDDRVHDESFCPESCLMDEETEELGQKEISAYELEKIKSKGMIQKECRDEPLADLARLEPASDNNMTEEKGQMFGKIGELCQIVCKPNSVRELESENLELSNKGKMLNNTASASNATSVEGINQKIQPDLNCIKQTLPDKQDRGEHRPTVVINRKISLSDPYIHECLQAPDSSQINKAVRVLEQKCEEKTSGAKCKILQDGGNDGFYHKLCKNFAPVVPSKIARIPTCPKVSLHEESGSLETFRRAYGKSDELKLASQESHLENNTKLPLTDRYEFNLKKVSVHYEDQRDAKEKEDTKKSKGLQTLVVSTDSKPISMQIGSKKSLAAKLCHLRQHRMNDPKELPNSCSSDGFQDINDDKNHSDSALNPETLPGCSTDFQLAEKEEGTASGDWLLHYDACAGKAAYVNKVTGLSRYDDPPVEEIRVRCTSDVTNLAVSVISELGEFVVALCLLAVSAAVRTI